MSAIRARLGRFEPDPAIVRWGPVVIAAEALLVLGYLALADVFITDPLVLVYPLVWIDVGIWAIATTRTAPASARQRRLAAAVGVGYFGLLAFVGGLLGPGHALHGHGHAFGFRVAWPLPPGWGPALVYGGSLVQFALIPYKAVGYLALAYLIYATVLDAAGSVVSGVVGLFSCVSCTWPVLGTVLTGVLGGSSAVAAAASNQPYLASTLVFLSAVGLLVWRPLA